MGCYNGPSDMELNLTEANDDSLSARMTELFKSLTPDMTIDKAYQLQEESEKKMKTLGRDDWREEIRRVFPSTFKTSHVCVMVVPRRRTRVFF